jgi:hypothetical protein
MLSLGAALTQLAHSGRIRMPALMRTIQRPMPRYVLVLEEDDDPDLKASHDIDFDYDPNLKVRGRERT